MDPGLSPSLVAPFVGAWIETYLYHLQRQYVSVAPFVGAWIETSVILANTIVFPVAPFVGAWIETIWKSIPAKRLESLPSWERGLKRNKSLRRTRVKFVAPFVGAWIETGRLYDP